MARLIQRIVEKPHPCPYLPEATASNEVLILRDVSPGELGHLLERGWRRFGPFYFRPRCSPCSECVSLRVPIATFEPTSSQKRIAKRAATLRRVVSAPQVDASRLDLYAKWHAQRRDARGWESSAMDAERYASDFAFPHPAARELALYDGSTLVGLGLFDETPKGLSAVYFFYDPDRAKLSLGTVNVLSLIDLAKSAGLSHLYLGYRVADCDSLKYKANFGPHEILVDRPDMPQEPAWRTPTGVMP